MAVVMNSYRPVNRRAIVAAGLGVTVIALLAVIGRYFSLSQPADDAENAALAEQAESNAQLMQEQLSEQLVDRPINDEQARLDSPMGQALFRQCLEWTEFHENHPGETTLQNRDKACDRYRGYIATGAEPE